MHTEYITKLWNEYKNDISSEKRKKKKVTKVPSHNVNLAHDCMKGPDAF